MNQTNNYLLKLVNPNTTINGVPSLFYETDPQETPLEIVIEVENIHDKSLYLKELKTSCGCSNPESNTISVLNPGEKGNIVIKFSYVNSTYAGHIFTKSVSVLMTENQNDQSGKTVFSQSFTVKVKK